MISDVRLGRRSFIGLSVITGTAFLVGPGATPASAQPSEPQEWTGSISANGWPVLDSCEEALVEGSGASVWLAPGDAAVVLGHIARRTNYEWQELQAGSVRSWSANRSVEASFESNYLSGSAICVTESLYPLGAAENLFQSQQLVIRDIVAECGGVIAWGGDLEPAKEGHFEITVGPDDPRLRALADTIRAWADQAGVGPGATDATEPARIAEAEAYDQAADGNSD